MFTINISNINKNINNKSNKYTSKNLFFYIAIISFGLTGCLNSGSANADNNAINHNNQLLTSNYNSRADNANQVNSINVQDGQKNNTQLPNFIHLVKLVGNTVVNITAEATMNGNEAQMDPFFELFKQFGGQIPIPKPQPQIKIAMGSGFIISSDGYILTNAHVVDGAKKIIVKTTTKQELIAKLIGLDKKTDIALLKVNVNNLPFVKIGNPAQLEVGEWVAAIGAPFGFDNSVTQGIVSAKGRNLPDDNYIPFIQSDVPVNPGNSGGPLFNLNGEVVGINSQIYSRSGGYMGISFSIPIDIAMNISNQLKQYGKVSHGQLGVQVQLVTQNLAKSFGLNSTNGALVAQIVPSQAAQKAGIMVGDIITKVDNQTIVDSASLPLIIGSKHPNDIVIIEVFRNHKYFTFKVKLGGNDDGQDKKNTEDDKKNILDITKFGLKLRDINPTEQEQLRLKSAVIVNASEGIAQMAGIMARDIILSINNSKVNNISEINKLISNQNTITLLILRDGQQMFISLSIG